MGGLGRPAWGEIHHLSRADAEHRVHASLHEEGQMRIGTQPPIRHQPITGGNQRMHRLHLSQVMGQQGCHDPRQEHTGAGME